MTEKRSKQEPSDRREYWVLTQSGLRSLLLEELQELGIEVTGRLGQGVRFEGSDEDLALVLTRSRLCSRVFLPIRSWKVADPSHLYFKTKKIHWPNFFGGKKPDFAIFSQAQGHCPFALTLATLKVKDAICDAYRRYKLPRPDVNRQNPECRLHLFFDSSKFNLLVSLTREPLYRRLGLVDGALAPLKESRAAALIRLCQKHSHIETPQKVIDPFCGSGTILLEFIQSLHPHGGHDWEFGREEWRDSISVFEDKSRILSAIQKRLEAEDEFARNIELAFEGWDQSNNMIKRAVKRAGKKKLKGVEWINKSALEIDDYPENSWVLGNPPYGARMGDMTETAHRLDKIYNGLKESGKKVTIAWVLTEELFQAMDCHSEVVARLDFPQGKIPSLLAVFNLG